MILKKEHWLLFLALFSPLAFSTPSLSSSEVTTLKVLSRRGEYEGRELREATNEQRLQEWDLRHGKVMRCAARLVQLTTFSSVGFYAHLSRLIDAQLVNFEVRAEIIEGVEIKRHFYWITELGFSAMRLNDPS